MSTALDGEESFYILGGRVSYYADAALYNDVYRSSFSFRDVNKVRAACNINIPACGVGLTCWPGLDGTMVTPNGVTCNAITACQAANFRPSSSSSTGPARRSSSSTSAPRKPPPAYDPCYDDFPVTDPYCDTFIASTGGADGKQAGLTTWAIGGIVVLVALVVGGCLLFMYKRWKGSSAAAAQSHATSSGTRENLLGEGETNSSVQYTAA